jgi:hypothetical protein
METRSCTVAVGNGGSGGSSGGSLPCPIDCAVPPWSAVKKEVAGAKAGALAFAFSHVSATEVSCEACSVTCGGGKMKCVRVPSTLPQHGGTACTREQLHKVYDCNWNRCPVSCSVSAWRWLQSGNLYPTTTSRTTTSTATSTSSHVGSTCDQPCGGGVEHSVRQITVSAVAGGLACPALFGSRSCNTQVLRFHTTRPTRCTPLI